MEDVGIVGGVGATTLKPSQKILQRHADRGNFYDILEQQASDSAAVTSSTSYIPAFAGNRVSSSQEHSHAKIICRSVTVVLAVFMMILVGCFMLYSASVRANYAESYAFSLDQRLSLLERNYTTTYSLVQQCLIKLNE